MTKAYLWLFSVFLSYPLCLSANELTEQRKLFWQARQSLIRHNPHQFIQLKPALKTYPLYPYLLYLELEQRFAFQNSKKVDYFFTHYPDTPLADKLRNQYLMILFEKGAYHNFLHYYRPSNLPVVQCAHLNALWATQQKKEAYQTLAHLWLKWDRPPPACQRLWRQWERDRHFSQAMLWQKMAQAIQTRNKAIIYHLNSFLSPHEKQQVNRWLEIKKNPLLITKTYLFHPKNKLEHHIILDGLQSLARQKPDQFIKYWPQLTKKYALTDQEQQPLLSMLSITLARQSAEQSRYWLAQIKPHYASPVLREWRVRQELRHKNWKKVLYWLDRLTKKEQQLPCWRYWRARALAETQHLTEAQEIYQSLAQQVDYYGILASQQLRKQYQPQTHRSLITTQSLRHHPGIQRAQELYLLGFMNDARREWQWAIDHLPPQRQHAAAYLAKNWGWYDLAIIGAAKAKAFTDVKLRFPFAYRTKVLASAKKNHLNPAWIWAIMRQESAFMPYARSSAGALGLMQMMPMTAKTLSTHRPITPADLLKTEVNIQLGSRYLNKLLSYFSGNRLLATAAYNIGPTRIKDYKPLYTQLPADIWVEILPWKETREYIKSVSLARAIYEKIR